MTDSIVLEKAIEAIVVLNAAFTNIRLYPSTSAMIGKSIDNTESIINEIFSRQDSITFAESEKNLIISGRGLDEKDNKRPQVIAFVQMMLKLGVKSFTFEKGLEKSELLGFLEVVTKKPEDLRKEGGIQQVMSEKGMHHIHLDQKIYVSVDKGQRIVDAINTHDSKPTPEKTQLQQIKAGIESLIRGESEPFKNPLIMQALTPAVLDLVSHGKEKTADAIINRLGQRMLSEDSEDRNEASMALARIGSKFLSEKRFGEMIKLSPKLAEWIKFETAPPPAYKHITHQLRVLTQYLIVNRRFSEAAELLSPFHMIESGRIKKDEPTKAMFASLLKEIASNDVMQSLTRELKADADKVDEHAFEVMIMLGLETKQKAPAEKDASESAETPASEPKSESLNLSATEIELMQHVKSVDRLVQNKEVKAAAKMLFDLTVSYAQKKDFESAETLRDKLMDIDPMALSDIIRSGEIIEEEKSKAIDQTHLNLWANLYKTMTKEEATNLYFSMKSVKFDAGRLIFRKGDSDSRLYFINKGRIKLFVDQGGKEIFIRELKPGELMGQEAFFTLSLCTSSAIALTAVELNYLEKAVLAKWDAKSYGIEAKLHDYHLKSRKAEEAQGEKGPQLRVHERIAISGKVKVQFMDSAGTAAGESIIGALSDISYGGMSFYLNIKKEKISGLFLNPRLNMKFTLKTVEAEYPVDRNGTMIAAVPHFYDYSIHVKFDSRLEKKMLEGIKTSDSSEETELDFLRDS
jgi:CRP-like cAMP-binding protein